jgi:phage recombination protein Bet
MNALVVQNNDLISFDDKKLSLIRSTVARDLTPIEFDFFIAVARSRGLDPILNQIHAVVRGKDDKRKMTIQVGIDGFRLIASRTGDFAGIDAPKFLYDKEGRADRCQVTVYRMVQNQRCAFVATAKWSEYVPEGNMAFMWNKMPEVMLSKVTEAQALRNAPSGSRRHSAERA